MTAHWPDIHYDAWRETCSALHLYMQIVGKYRLARTPWVNHSWHATFYVNARGFTTSLIPDGTGGVEIVLDLLDHKVIGTTDSGRTSGFDLAPLSVADFHARFIELLGALGATPKFHGSPNEIPDPTPFAEDHAERPYDAEAVTRFFHACVASDRVFKRFRTAFLGKVSPVHLFWGALDVAVTRFSGRLAPLHPGGIPALPDEVTQEAYSHEVSSAGFWPGGAGTDFPAFYSYAYPAPPGFADAPVTPEAAYFDANLGEFLLPYDAVRRSSDPEAALMAFLDSTYRAAADLGQWDRESLECPTGEPLRPRPLSTEAGPPGHGGHLAPSANPQELRIEREEGASKGRYVVRLEGVKAEMTYSRAGASMIIIDHTDVPDALRGRSVGQALVRRAIEDARAEGRSIIPLCPFAKAQIERHAEWQDVLKR